MPVVSKALNLKNTSRNGAAERLSERKDFGIDIDIYNWYLKVLAEVIEPWTAYFALHI